jgi:hypothetical protein
VVLLVDSAHPLDRLGLGVGELLWRRLTSCTEHVSPTRVHGPTSLLTGWASPIRTRFKGPMGRWAHWWRDQSDRSELWQADVRELQLLPAAFPFTASSDAREGGWCGEVSRDKAGVRREVATARVGAGGASAPAPEAAHVGPAAASASRPPLWGPTTVSGISL